MYVAIKVEIDDTPYGDGEINIVRTGDLNVSDGTQLRLDELAKKLMQDAYDAYMKARDKKLAREAWEAFEKDLEQLKHNIEDIKTEQPEVDISAHVEA